VPELIIGPMLRHVADTSATIFVETDRPCEVEVLGHRARTFTVRRRHYALVVVDGLEPGSTTEYAVTLDGEPCWPLPADRVADLDPGVADLRLPPSVIRTRPDDDPGRVRLLFGSCRTAAPHEPPWTLELARDERGRGVDAMWAHAVRMMQQEPDEWPDLMLLMGDQVYADDTSPATRERIEKRRDEGEDLPSDLVRDFEEYCWLYHESWRPIVERWLFSVMPTAMIFDDHDMIDDWNISEQWVHDVRQKPWWDEHVIGGLVSYWVYQHLGNLSPAQVAEQGILEQACAVTDAWELLRDWARQSEQFTPVAGGYRFSFSRDIGRTKVVVLDARNGRVLDHGKRAMVDAIEWDWLVEQCHEDFDHLVIVSSLPVFVPGGLHDIQVWNEVLCDGRWGARPAALGERLRRSIDLEDWPAFATSFDAFVELLGDLGSGAFGTPPASITVLSGDIHFSYLADVTYPAARGVTTPIRQVVCSPLRNALPPQERAVIRFALTRTGRAIGRALRRAAGRRRTACSWTITEGPVFANCIGLASLDARGVEVCVEQAVSTPSDGVDHPHELAMVFERRIPGTSPDDPATRLSASGAG
jgi:hypothetical protein